MVRCIICIKKCRICIRHRFLHGWTDRKSWLLWYRKQKADTKKIVSHARYREIVHELIYTCLYIGLNWWQKVNCRIYWQTGARQSQGYIKYDIFTMTQYIATNQVCRWTSDDWMSGWMKEDGVLFSFRFNVFSNSLKIRSPYAPQWSALEPYTNRWEVNGLSSC